MSSGPDMSSLVEKVLPGEVRSVLSRAGDLSTRSSMPAYLVGGVVRDLLLGVPNLDIDLVVEGEGPLFAKRLADELGAEVTVHHPFSTATLTITGGLRLDVATARAEEYAEPAALPEVKPATMAEDLRRRDFTVNAMAMRLGDSERGELLDPFQGRNDLKEKVIRVLHDGSFIDDPTRMFRAIRYETRLGFRVEDRSLRLLGEALSEGMVEKLSGERIRNELWLIFEEEKVGETLRRLEDMGVLARVHPNLKFTYLAQRLTSAFRELLPGFRGRLRFDSHIVFLFALLETADFGRAVEIGKRLSLKRSEIEKIVQFKLSLAKIGELSREELKPSRVSSVLRGLSAELLLFAVARARDERVTARISAFVDRYSKVRLEITGEDLKAFGVPEGPIYQEILGKVLDARLDGVVKTKEQEAHLARELFQTRQ